MDKKIRRIIYFASHLALFVLFVVVLPRWLVILNFQLALHLKLSVQNLQ